MRPGGRGTLQDTVLPVPCTEPDIVGRGAQTCVVTAGQFQVARQDGVEDQEVAVGPVTEAVLVGEQGLDGIAVPALALVRGDQFTQHADGVRRQAQGLPQRRYRQVGHTALDARVPVVVQRAHPVGVRRQCRGGLAQVVEPGRLRGPAHHRRHLPQRRRGRTPQLQERTGDITSVEALPGRGQVGGSGTAIPAREHAGDPRRNRACPQPN